MATTLAAGLIAAAVWLAYRRDFSGPFLFDDYLAIVDNPSIRHLWPLRDVLHPVHAGISGTTGRPLLNLSFALNYAWGGLNVHSYRVVNVALHLLCGWILFGVLRRLGPAWGGGAVEVAALTACFWVVHPLQTETVMCLVDRSELLMAFFYLLTLYGFVRLAAPPPTGARPKGGYWAVLSVGACLAGMATKEAMVTAPAVVLLLDRTFLAGSFAAAWRRRRSYYLALTATWLLLAWLVAEEGGRRGPSAGFGQGVGIASYALTQCWAIAHYLRLVFWPAPLVLDYGTLIKRAGEVLPEMVLLAGLAATAAWLLRTESERAGQLPPRGWRAAGFATASFFILLSPSSSIIPLAAQTVAEHRMYLPLAAVLAVVVTAWWHWAGRRGLLLALPVLVALIAVTRARNRLYQDEVAIFRQTVAEVPDNARAQNNLGTGYFRIGRLAAAAAAFHEALRLVPTYAEAHLNLGDTFYQLGDFRAATGEYRLGLDFDATSARGHNGFGSALREVGKTAEAEQEFRAALRLQPAFPQAHNNLGSLLGNQGRLAAAAAEFSEAVRLDPNYIEARRNLALALQALQRPAAP